MRISDWSSDVCSSDLVPIIGLPLIAALFAIEQHQFAAELLQHDLGAELLRTGLVGPLAGLDLAFEIDLRALAQIAGRDLAKPPVADHHPVPFGALLALSAGVLPVLRRGDAKVDDLRSDEHPSDLRSLMHNSYAVFLLKKKITI